MDFPHGVYVTLKSVTTAEDQYGNSSTTETTRRWGPVARAPRFADEQTGTRTVPVIVGEVLYGPKVAIDSDDLIVIGDETFAVDGLPGEWKNPFTGWDPGIEVPIKRAAAV